MFTNRTGKHGNQSVKPIGNRSDAIKCWDLFVQKRSTNISAVGVHYYLLAASKCGRPLISSTVNWNRLHASDDLTCCAVILFMVFRNSNLIRKNHMHASSTTLTNCECTIITKCSFCVHLFHQFHCVLRMNFVVLHFFIRILFSLRMVRQFVDLSAAASLPLASTILVRVLTPPASACWTQFNESKNKINP